MARLIERDDGRFAAGATSLAVTATFMIVFIRPLPRAKGECSAQ
jgi:hypothetical protein